MSRINDYATDNLLGCEYFSKHYKLIAIDLSKQTELENTYLKQQIIFVGRLKEHNATMFFIIEKKRRNHFLFLTQFCNYCLIRLKWKLYQTLNIKLIFKICNKKCY